jgi:hypothetical protein
MNVSRTGVLVNCSVTFATQWIRFSYVPAARLDGIVLAGQCDQNLLKEGPENADLLVFTQAPPFAESVGRGWPANSGASHRRSRGRLVSQGSFCWHHCNACKANVAAEILLAAAEIARQPARIARWKYSLRRKPITDSSRVPAVPLRLRYLMAMEPAVSL